jgi:hypothetical protein
MWDVGQTAVFEDWWGELSEQEQDDVTAIVELLQEMGPTAALPPLLGRGGLQAQPYARAAHSIPR